MSTIDSTTPELEPMGPATPRPSARPRSQRPGVPLRFRPVNWVRNGGPSRLLFLLPLILIFGAFSWYPIVKLVLMSFQQTNEVTTTWVGLQNFKEVLSDPLFPIAVRNTLEFAGLALL